MTAELIKICWACVGRWRQPVEFPQNLQRHRSLFSRSVLFNLTFFCYLSKTSELKSGILVYICMLKESWHAVELPLNRQSTWSSFSESTLFNFTFFFCWISKTVGHSSINSGHVDKKSLAVKFRQIQQCRSNSVFTIKHWILMYSLYKQLCRWIGRLAKHLASCVR